MNISLDNLLNNSYVVSINNKTMARFNSVFLHAGFKTLPKMMPGFIFTQKQIEDDSFLKATSQVAGKLKYGALGCGVSHACLVRHAYLSNLDFICIFEDDAYPCDKILEKLPKFLTNIPDECDILKLGWSKVYRGRIDTNKAHSYGAKSWGTFAYIIFKKHY